MSRSTYSSWITASTRSSTSIHQCGWPGTPTKTPRMNRPVGGNVSNTDAGIWSSGRMPKIGNLHGAVNSMKLLPKGLGLRRRVHDDDRQANVRRREVVTLQDHEVCRRQTGLSL